MIGLSGVELIEATRAGALPTCRNSRSRLERRHDILLRGQHILARNRNDERPINP
jgi:hypothetical protein